MSPVSSPVPSTFPFISCSPILFARARLFHPFKSVLSALFRACCFNVLVFFSSLFFVRSSFLFYSLRFKKRKDTFYNFSILSLFIVSKNMLLRIYRSTVLFSSSLIHNGRNKLLLSSNFRSAQREAIFLPPSPRGKHRDFGLSTEWSSLFFLFFPVSYDSNRIDLNKVANRDVKLYAGRFTNRFLESCTASLPLQ